MRIVLKQYKRELYFNTLKRKAYVPWQQLSKILDVNNRMLRSWRSGEFTIPEDLFKKVYKI